jgi:D-alanyl-D-alanine carboxypeptidase
LRYTSNRRLETSDIPPEFMYAYGMSHVSRIVGAATRALLVLFLIPGQIPAAATRARAVRSPSAPSAPEALVTAAHQAAGAALKAGVPAVQIAASRGGQIIYAEAFGMADQESATAATARSAMQIGSVTKQFTAAAILRLAERGALTLDDRIEKFVPDFNPRGAKITLRHLLNHTSGLRRNWYAPTAAVDLSVPVTRAEVIKGINEQPFDFAPGQKWSYSNAGYMLLGYAIESITGRPFADFFRDEFALPLGLIDTGVCGTFNLPLPDGYGLFTTSKGPLWARLHAWQPSTVLSAGSLCSTASDLTRWSHMLASGGVVLPDSYAAMTTPVPPEIHAAVPYGLGVVAQNVLGHPAVWHDGAVEGFHSYLVYFADQDLAIAVLTNAYPDPPAGDPITIGNTIAKAALSAQ